MNQKFSVAGLKAILSHMPVGELHGAKIDGAYYLMTDDNELLYPRVMRSRAQVLRDVRNAIVHCNVKIRDEDQTKSGQYVSDWIVLDKYAVCVCAIRRGGVGAIVETREEFNKARAEWQKNMPEIEKKKLLKAQALAKLTQEERIALGV